jgi:FMN phosphatase YigB (HAD superfamily)
MWFDVGNTLYADSPAYLEAHDTHRYAAYGALTGQADPQTAKVEYDARHEQYGSNAAVFRSLGMPPGYWQAIFEEKDFVSLLDPDPEALPTLESIRDITPISILTNYGKTNLQRLLGRLGLPEEYFDHIITSDDLHEKKPSEEGYRRAIELSGVPAYENMFVGDRVDVDILPAQRLGMATCLVRNETGAADYVTRSFSGVYLILQHRNAL